MRDLLFDIAVGPDLIRGGYPMQWYVLFFLYVCMMVLHPYLNHKGEPQRDDEIDGEERDGEGCQTESMYVCM